MDHAKSLPGISFDADDGSDSFEDNYGDAEVGTAVPIDESSVNNHLVGSKCVDVEANSRRRNWLYPLFVLMALSIVGLSIGISITTRRGNASKLTMEAETINPTLNPSSIPSTTSSSRPSFYSSSVPSATPSSAHSSVPSLSGNVSPC